jgi:HK97 family phage major capsid protein
MFLELLKAVLGKSAGERIWVSDKAEAEKMIAGGDAKAIPGDALGPTIQQAVRDQFAALNLNQVITDTLKQFADAQAQSRKVSAPILFGEGGQGDAKKSFGDWALAVARGDSRYLEKHYGSVFNPWSTKAALGESSGVTGGYTVPVDFYKQLMAVMAENAFIRPRAFVYPMGSATTQFPYLDITTVQAAGTSPFFGGVLMNWTAEAQTRTETEPQFKMMELRAWELSGYSVSSNVLLQDSVVGLEKVLFGLFAKAIVWYEEFAFLQGNGVGKPQGMLTAPAAIAFNRSLAGHIQYADVAGMWAKLLPVSWGNAVWTISPSVVPDLLQLKDGAGRAIFISIDQGAAKSPTWNLLGRPVFPTEKVPALGTKGDLMLLDPAFYVIGDRQQIEIAASEHVNFLKNQMTWRVVERVDGQPWLDKAITLQDAATTVSPFVVLN